MIGERFLGAVRILVRLGLRGMGYTRPEILFMLDLIDDRTVAEARVKAGVEIPVEPQEGAPAGDLRDFVRRVVEWLKSPEGKAFIAALIQIILLLLAA